MNIYIVLLILFAHWVADFVCQTDYMAQNKSKRWKPLLLHTVTYSSIMLTTIMFIFHYSFVPVILFATTTFALHTTTDYFTSRLNSKLWADKKVHLFFVSVGFDQFLHFAQLLITYQLLKP